MYEMCAYIWIVIVTKAEQLWCHCLSLTLPLALSHFVCLSVLRFVCPCPQQKGKKIVPNNIIVCRKKAHCTINNVMTSFYVCDSICVIFISLYRYGSFFARWLSFIFFLFHVAVSVCFAKQHQHLPKVFVWRFRLAWQARKKWKKLHPSDQCRDFLSIDKQTRNGERYWRVAKMMTVSFRSC